MLLQPAQSLQKLKPLSRLCHDKSIDRHRVVSAEAVGVLVGVAVQLNSKRRKCGVFRGARRKANRRRQELTESLRFVRIRMHGTIDDITSERHECVGSSADK